MRKIIIINSYGRSGGSLLARLFDFHKEIFSLPFEGHFSPSDVFLPKAGGTIENINTLEDIYAAFNIKRHIVTLLKGYVIKGGGQKVSIVFNYEMFRKNFEKKVKK